MPAPALPPRPGQDEDAHVVIVHFGDLGDTVQLANQMAAFAANVTVVANDLKARPDSVAPQVRWAMPPENLGYAAGILFAVESGPASRYVLALNSDVELPRDTFLHCLAQLDEDPSIGVLAPILRHPDGSLQAGAGALVGVLRREQIHTDPGARLADCTWVTGAAMFVRVSALRECDWDTGYFLGFEDIDLCVRMARRGHRVVCDGRVAATHGLAQEIGTLWYYYYFRNRLWFARKNFSAARAAMIAVDSVRDAAKVWLGDLVLRRGFAKSGLVGSGVRDGLRPHMNHQPQDLPEQSGPLELRWRRTA